MASVFVFHIGLSAVFLEVDVPAPARIGGIFKALRSTFNLSGPQLAITELRLVAASGPQPTPDAIAAALAEDYAVFAWKRPSAAPRALARARGW